ncbi:hypothetical protein DH2020_011487 [Rehmannia glutinosa]|uniref:R2R3-MYB protein n=1 Tax=Rehmannia glutinosa TaxID=99300 RepID=A0ABR0XDL9_REHGL
MILTYNAVTRDSKTGSLKEKPKKFGILLKRLEFSAMGREGSHREVNRDGKEGSRRDEEIIFGGQQERRLEKIVGNGGDISFWHDPWVEGTRLDHRFERWSAIAARLPGRTDNEIKNYWNTHIRKRLLRMGIDPVTHAPRLDLLDLSSLLSSPQLNLSSLIRLQTLVNPEALRLAMNLLSSQNDQNQLFNSQLQNQQAPLIQPNHFDNIINQQIPSNDLTTSSFPNQSQSMQGNMGHFPVGSTNSTGQIFQNNLKPTTSDQSLPSTDIPSFCYQMKSDSLSDNSSFDQSLNYSSSSTNNFSFDNSVLSTPLSSPPPLNSASGVINGSTEDERDNFCSNLLRFEIPEGLDFADFI